METIAQYDVGEHISNEIKLNQNDKTRIVKIMYLIR